MILQAIDTAEFSTSAARHEGTPLRGFSARQL
jgi:hypothetical protein